MLATDAYRVQGLIQMSNVEVICTTDDPYDTLEYQLYNVLLTKMQKNISIFELIKWESKKEYW